MLTRLTRPSTRPSFAISIRQPWAELILSHRKDMEYRLWRLPEKFWHVWLYLHAPANMTSQEQEMARKRLGTVLQFRGGYIGLIKFGCPNWCRTPTEVRHLIKNPRCWHWPIEAVERIPLIPARGRLRIFAVREPADG